jgi:hypothetical protein
MYTSMLHEIEGWILPLLIPPLSKILPALHKKTSEQAQPAEEPGNDDDVSCLARILNM